jgi:hypothetical protein
MQCLLQYNVMLDLSFLCSYIAEYRQEVAQLHVRSVTGINNGSFETLSDPSYRKVSSRNL